MLGNLVQKEIVLGVMAILLGLCVIIKMISAITVRKLVRAAREIHKSNHKFMKLIKSKFEHASLVSNRVQNVEAFVEKYLYEYKVIGIRLQSFQSIIKTLIWMIGLLGVVGIFESYRMEGMGSLTFQYAQWTGIFLMLLLLLQFVEEDKAKIQATKVYVIEYLENVCAHRYAKLNQKEMVEEKKEEAYTDEKNEEVQEEPLPLAEPEDSIRRSEQEKRIRAILEEFLT